jgi:diacylglycerol O-acyltransferase
MAHGRDSDRLSWGDALFLYLEREGMPLNIASVFAFDGTISLDACRQFIESKLPLIPRYLQRVVAPPFNIGLPAWEYDPEFDVSNHVRQVRLKRGIDSEFKAIAGKILSKTMDRQRPLWDMTLVQGLKGNRTGVITRIHHCMADGIAGVGLMNVIMDESPEVPVLPKRKRRFRGSHRPDPLASLLDLWISSYSDIVQHALLAQSEVLSLAEKVVGGGGELPMEELLRLLPELTTPTEPLFFNVNCRGPQKFTWAQIPMEEIKAIRAAYGATHNDVVLALVTATIRRYAELHGDKVKGRLLRIMVPVNVRGADDHQKDLGNRISLLPVTIPLDIRSPRKLLAAARDRMAFLKCAHVAELVGLAGGLLSAAPTALQALAGPIASRLPITPFNLVCTNVRGPQFPLYLLGHKMLDWYPYVPVGGDMALNCAILSYNGTNYFGFTGDVNAAPDLTRLGKMLKLSLTELREVAGIKSPRRESTPPKAKVEPALAPPIRKPVTSVTAPSSVRPASVPIPTREGDKVLAGMAAD